MYVGCGKTVVSQITMEKKNGKSRKKGDNNTGKKRASGAST